MKTAFVAGSAGFIGSHLVRELQKKGYYVVGADILPEKYSHADVFYQYDLRDCDNCIHVFEAHGLDDETMEERVFDEIYLLSACMGGMGWIGDEQHAYTIMIGSSQMVINILNAAIRYKANKIFFSSSACVYNEHYQLHTEECALKESMAYPSLPDLTYGWQKLFSEKLLQAAQDKIDIRIARFHNIFGIEGIWDGGKEKYPAAICRKVAKAKNGDTIIIWGDGLQTRSYLNVDECLNCVFKLMDSDVNIPLNIGSDEMISCNDLAKMVIEISGKDLKIEHDLTKPQGVRGRNSDNTLIEKMLGYLPKQNLKEQMSRLYYWIYNELAKQTAKERKQKINADFVQKSIDELDEYSEYEND